MNRGLAGALVTLFVTLTVSIALVACSSGEPTVSGFGFGDSRLVSVGDPVIIRMPASSQTGQPEWRLKSFDSGRLQLVQRPTLEQIGNSNRRQWTIRFVARGLGDTVVELERIRRGNDGRGTIGATRRFTIGVNQ